MKIKEKEAIPLHLGPPDASVSKEMIPNHNPN